MPRPSWNSLWQTCVLDTQWWRFWETIRWKTQEVLLASCSLRWKFFRFDLLIEDMFCSRPEHVEGNSTQHSCHVYMYNHVYIYMHIYFLYIHILWWFYLIFILIYRILNLDIVTYTWHTIHCSSICGMSILLLFDDNAKTFMRTECVKHTRIDMFSGKLLMDICYHWQ